MNKKALRYLRFSSDDQSRHSIERQDEDTTAWTRSNNVSITDTFIDRGHSAKTFDRPDVIKLFDFIKKNYRQIDYLVVSELTRFSRDTGEAISMVKQIQTTYNIRIVSALQNHICDVFDSASFLRMGLEFLFGNTENIKRASDINGGVYTAKAIKGKWIQGGPAPYGYRKVRTGEEMHLEIVEEEAVVIRYIFDAYLKEVPVYIIKKEARAMGLRRKGSSVIQEVLTTPLYISHQKVKPCGTKPGGLFPIADLPPIVDGFTWQRVQEKIAGPKYKKTLIDDLPLRGILRCDCTQRVSGAFSTNKIGKKYPYYKCPKSKHLNLSATKAHDQLQQLLELLSLPEYLVDAIREQTGKEMMIHHQQSRKELNQAKKDLAKIEDDLLTVETKFISEKSIEADTYHSWHQRLSTSRVEVAARIEKFSRNEQEQWWLISQELGKLTDLRYLYNNISTADKQELLRQVFDDRLYYKSGTYRTPWIMETFSHNLLTLKEQNLLVLDGMNYQTEESPVMWTPPSHNRTLPDLLSFISTLKVA